MFIKEIEYPVTGKRKFAIVEFGKRYTCYLAPTMNMNMVVTGNGNNKEYEDLTDTLFASKCILSCLGERYDKEILTEEQFDCRYGNILETL